MSQLIEMLKILNTKVKNGNKIVIRNIIQMKKYLYPNLMCLKINSELLKREDFITSRLSVTLIKQFHHFIKTKIKSYPSLPLLVVLKHPEFSHKV